MPVTFKNAFLLIAANTSKRSIQCGCFMLISLVVFTVLLTTSNLDFEAAIPQRGDVDLVKAEPKPRQKRKIAVLGRKIKLPIHDQKDSELVKYVRSTIVPPSTADVRYNLKKKVFDNSLGQARVVMRLTHFQHEGFFVECGAGNGEDNSNTLLLERHLGWTGLLIEAYPSYSEDLLGVNRRAWFSASCLSSNSSAYESNYRETTLFMGKVVDQGASYKVPRTTPMKVPCFPLYTFMLALNVSKIDYLSLDVAENEVQVLESIPFDKLDITVISVEATKAHGGVAGVMDTMVRKGYKTVMELPPDDFIFVKKSYVVPYDHRDLLK